MSSKIREALLDASIALSWVTHHHLTEDDAKECLAKIDKALAEPLRNCDVGTAEEQWERQDKYCMLQDCNKCHTEDAAYECTKCYAKWSQMPLKAR